RGAMQQVLLACLPGLLVLFWVYGWGVLFNLVLSATTALLTEAALLRLRRR
ncbi:MAG TPA: electron transport complex subunit RsxD, partial [Pseudomonas sp.]|nr:electron transport complex subunit RsxD [Pseudomonas sp.]